MLKLGTVFALLLGLLSPALAQTTFTMPPPAGVTVIGIQVVASCGGGSLTANQIAYVAMDTTGALCTNASGGGGGLSVQDGATFTPSTSDFTPTGGEYNSSPTTLTSGKQGTVALNQYRSMFVDVMTSNNNLYTAITSAVPCSVTAAWNTNTGLTGTQPVACDGSANPYVDLGKNNGTAGTPSTSLLTVQGSTATGAALASYPLLVGGSDGTDVRNLSTDSSGNLNVNVKTAVAADPCWGTLKSQADFESTSSGGSIVAAASGKKVYVCAITAFASTATNFSVIEGTGSSVCTSGTPTGLFLNTGTTAANGAALAANGGLTFGNGSGTVFESNTADYNVCILFATTNTPQVNVHISYVQQ